MRSSKALKAPFPYPGGKSAIAKAIWKRLGSPAVYAEPFAGSLAVLLGNPSPAKIEIVSDLDCLLINFWRAWKYNHEAVIAAADAPKSTVELDSRRLACHTARVDVNDLLKSPEAHNVQVAGWWLYCMRNAIGKALAHGSLAQDSEGNIIYVSDKSGVSTGGLLIREYNIVHFATELYKRIVDVCIMHGDWSKAVTHGALTSGIRAQDKDPRHAVFLDPPYVVSKTSMYNHDSNEVAGSVEQWCIQRAEEWPWLRIAYALRGPTPPGMEQWERIDWVANGGYGNQGKDNIRRGMEAVLFSPNCIKPDDIDGEA